MEYEYTWHFEISKEANMAFDEYGQPSECYSKISMSFKEKKSDEKLQGMIPAITKHIAGTAAINEDWIKPISKEEYETETEPEYSR